MKRRQIILILFFVFGAMQILFAQENKLVVINLKTGYSVKGEIIEQTAQGVKIKTLEGEIFEYKANEINNTFDATSSSPSKIMLLNFGVGLGNTLVTNVGYKSLVPPFSTSMEVILKDNLFDGNVALGVGGYFCFSRYSISIRYYEGRHSNFIIGPRGYLHYKVMEKLDTYAGAMIGYNISGASAGGVIFSEFVGARYYFNDKYAAMAELGWGISIATIGVAIKL